MLSLLDRMINDTDKINTQLNDFLINCNVNTDKKNLTNSVVSLDKIVAIRKDKQYVGVSLKNGYVIDVVNIDGIVEKQVLPTDICRGYYKYENGNIKLDEKMRQRIWG